MLFNSYSFLLLFLPLLLVSWRLAATYAPARLGLVLLLFSVVFYGLWGLPFLVLLAVILGMQNHDLSDMPWMIQRPVRRIVLLL